MDFKNISGLLAMVVLVSAVLSFLLSGYSPIRIPGYSEGDIAASDILVPADILITDDPATKARKASAQNAVPPVYIDDPSGRTVLVSRISEAFSTCRRTLEPMVVGDRDLLFRKLAPEIQISIKAQLERVAPQPDNELLDFLVRKRFDSETESQLISAVSHALSLWLVESERDLIGTAGEIEIAARSDQEKQIVPVEQVFDLDYARARLRESFNLNLNALPRIRQIASEWLGRELSANLRFDLPATEARKSEAAESVDPVLRQLKKGKVIVRQGDEISADHLKQIEAVRNLTPSLRSIPQFAGTYLLLIVLLTILALLLRSWPVRQWSPAKLPLLCFLTLVANVGILKLFWLISDSLSRNFVANPFNDSKLFFPALPFAFGSMLITLLAGDRVSRLFLIFYFPIAIQITGAGFQDALFILAANLIGILAIRHARQRMTIIAAGFKLSAAAVLLFIAVHFTKRADLDLSTGAFGAAMAFLSGPITASFLTFALPLCERLFLVTTEIRLSELGNLNLPLLRDLILRAPGTYNHSVAVGTLAQGAANSIGLNALFLRVASLYHDIGKSLHPQFFIENQGEDGNPHDSLDPQESVRIIRQHVTEGIRLGREAGLPPAVIDIIPQHHGTKLLSYFYDKAKQLPGARFDGIYMDDYRYHGPKPQTKEAAVIMLADAIEAAARTLPDHSQERLLSMIKKITQAAMEDGQLAECDLTLSEIERISFSFMETLASFYHSRIDYPSFDFGAKVIARAPNKQKNS